MRALTIWQPWASLIIAGAKPFEFRRWPAPNAVVGQRIVIHASARKVDLDELRELLMHVRRDDPHGALVRDIALPLLERWSLAPALLPRACGLGTALLGAPRRALNLHADGLVRGEPCDIDPDMWGWPLSEIEPFTPPVPMRGERGFWAWPEQERMAL